MGIPIRQTSFAGGELAPNLYARPDLAKYAVGLARCHNFFVSRQGQAVSRPGTEYLGVTLNTTVLPGGTPSSSRLVPFVFSDSLAYVLEFGNHYVAFWQNGARILSGGLTYQVTTPYALADLPKLKFVQSGSVLQITLTGYPPASLTRVSDTNWTYAAMSFGRPAIQAPSYVGGDPVFLDSVTNTSSAIDPSHPGAAWKWGYTQLTRNSDGSLSESVLQIITHLGTTISPFTQTAMADGQAFAVYPDKPQKLTIGLRVNEIPIYRFYRGQGGTWGWIGDCNGFYFMDLGNAPDYTIAPPQGLNPLQVLNPDGSVASTETPTAVSFFEDRMMFLGTNGRPMEVLGSATSDYYNFDTRLYPVENEAIDFALAARKREEIRSAVPLTKQLIFTDAAVWAIGGANGPLSFDNVDAKVQVEVGANWVDPVVIDGVALFARTKGTGLRALGFDFQKQAFSGADMSLYASHLLEDNQVVGMAFCEDPWSVLWVLRDDGVLLSFTFIKDQDVWAWAWHDFAGGQVRSICSVPENGEDVLYMVVQRGKNAGGGGNYSVERMKSRKLELIENSDGTYAEQPWCVDCGVQTAASAPAVAPRGWHSEPVWALGDGVVYGPFATDSTGSITDALPDQLLAASNIIWGIGFTSELETLDPVVPGKETRLVEKIVNRVLVETQDSVTFQAGPDFNPDNLKDFTSRLVTDGYGAQPQRSEAAEVWIPGGWGPTGHVCISTSQPLPLTVLGITRDIETGEA